MHALVTGASAGIGEAIARKLAAEGCSLTLVARREERLRTLADELEPECFVRPADLSDGAVVDGLLAEAINALGPVDILINNAGIQYVEPAVGISRERIEKMFAVNVTTPFALQNAVLSDMVERGSGTVVNISSMSAITPTPGMSHYSASKSALAAASEAMRAELVDSGVNIFTVYPGPVATEMERKAREKMPDGIADKIPTGTPEGLADLIWKGIRKGEARLIYPRVYGATRWFRNTSEWITRTFTPPPVDEG